MTRASLTQLIATIVLLGTPAYTRGGEYVKTSGISKNFHQPFTLTKENVQDITARVLKAQVKLAEKSDFFIHFHRRDDRYFQVSTAAELFSDPNSPYASLDYMSWNLLQRYPEDPAGSPPRRLIFIKYDVDEGVRMQVDGREMDWALLAADDIEASVKRTVASGFNYVNLLILFLGVATYFFLARLIAKLFARQKFKARETDFVINQLLLVLIIVPPMALLAWTTLRWDKFQDWLHNSSSFLWGDMIATHGETNQLHNNLLWAVIVGLVVSIVANFATARLIAIRSGIGTNKEATDPDLPATKSTDHQSPK